MKQLRTVWTMALSLGFASWASRGGGHLRDDYNHQVSHRGQPVGGTRDLHDND